MSRRLATPVRIEIIPQYSEFNELSGTPAGDILMGEGQDGRKPTPV